MVGEGLGQPAVHGERAAPVAVLLAEGGHGGVDGEAVQHGLEDGVAQGDDLGLGQRLSVRARRPSATSWRWRCTRGFCAAGRSISGFLSSIFSTLPLENIRSPMASGATVDPRGDLQGNGKLGDPAHPLQGLLLDGLQLVALCDLARHEVFAEALDAVHVLPERDFFLCAVGRGVRGRMARVAVGDHVEQHRARVPRAGPSSCARSRPRRPGGCSRPRARRASARGSPPRRCARAP